VKTDYKNTNSFTSSPEFFLEGGVTFIRFGCLMTKVNFTLRRHIMTAAVIPGSRAPYGARQLQGYIAFSTWRAFLVANAFFASLFMLSWLLLATPSVPERSQYAGPTIVTDYNDQLRNLLPRAPAEPASTPAATPGESISNETDGKFTAVADPVDPQIEVKPTAPYNQYASLGAPNGTRTTIENGSQEVLTQPFAEPVPDTWDFVVVEKEPEFDLKLLHSLLVYPEMARRAGIEGRVVLRVLITPEGKAGRIDVDASPHPMLSAAAVEAVRKIPFTPARQNGERAYFWISIPLEFRLRTP